MDQKKSDFDKSSPDKVERFDDSKPSQSRDFVDDQKKDIREDGLPAQSGKIAGTHGHGSSDVRGKDIKKDQKPDQIRKPSDPV